jgi:hypothetical protein
LAEALAETVTVPDTVDPFTGVTIETVGGVLETPFPDKLRRADGPEASLTMETLPFAAPAAAGVNRTWMAADCPAAITAPEASPLTVKPLPVVLTCETCTVA